MLNKYELMVILDPTLGEGNFADFTNQVEEIIKANGGQDLTKDVWGMRDLAYTIKKQSKGYYILFKFSSTGLNNKKIENSLNLVKEVYRYLIIKDESEKLLKKIKAKAEAKAKRQKVKSEAKARYEKGKEKEESGN